MNYAKSPMNSREAAFLAVLHSLRGECFIADYLDRWYSTENPNIQDYHLAQQIAYGSAQMTSALDYLALKVSEKKKMQLKLKEKCLLRTAIYQLHFLDRIPAYAIVDESIKIAKKYFHHYFVSYLNAILRKLCEIKPSLPEERDLFSLSIRYSFPLSFVHQLEKAYGLEKTIDVLNASNQPAITMARARTLRTDSWPFLIENPVKMMVIPPEDVENVSLSSDYYIQNVTPAFLIGSLAQKLKSAPKRILDMCSSPGGKSLAIHDFFPHAALHANDVSEEKLLKLKENFEKYHVDATLSCNKGETLDFSEKFDLIILDVPCSNSGVLNKRPEARWRLTEEQSKQLEKTQIDLLKQAYKLLQPSGEIWYMTCSILPSENEELLAQVCSELPLKSCENICILPNEKGWDGGFAARLKST